MNQIRQATQDLLNLAMLIGPEGEEMDVSDLELELEDIVEITNTLGRLRKAGELVKRSLAQEWNNQYEHKAVIYGEDEYYLGYASKKVFIEGQEAAFTEWVMEQDADVVQKIIGPAYNIPMTPLGRPGSPIRETFFDEVKTSEDLRIQSRPRRDK